MNLACCIVLIYHFYLFFLMCDDQVVNLLQIEQVVFQILGFFVEKLYAQANFVNLNLN